MVAKARVFACSSPTPRDWVIPSLPCMVFPGFHNYLYPKQLDQASRDQPKCDTVVRTLWDVPQNAGFSDYLPDKDSEQ